MKPLLRVEGLRTHFPVLSGALRRRTGTVFAVDGVDMTLAPGETLAIVGESGCGKSTLARTVIRLLEPTAGSIRFRDRDVTRARGRELHAYLRHVQMVFQDPYSSLNPRLTARQALAEPMRTFGVYDRLGGRRRIDELLERVGISPGDGGRYPDQFSGGQRQRIAIARALAPGPEVVILDEPVAALDVSIQAQIVNLLRDLQRELQVAYLFISHDLAVVEQIAHRIAVMYLGRVVETGPARAVLGATRHPYTTALVSAIPISDPAERGSTRRITLQGEVPSPASPPSGCRFHTRCWKAQAVCAEEEPALAADGDAPHAAACHFPERPAPVPVRS